MMRKKRFLALLLSFVMVFSCSFTAFAEEESVDTNETTEEVQEEQIAETQAEVDASVWTSEDFTYVSYEKLLYGCDYTRQFTVSGIAIAGLSESGEEKLTQNTALVIPATDTEGTPIVGVADNAFKNKGITSVEFPTGMMVDYDDTITNKVTKRGNFIIAEGAFAGNKLTSVTLPEGVIAVLPYAFNNNLIETVKLPKTIWWIETMAFTNNRITTVDFPTTCDFQLEMHGLAFAKNFIESVRIPDYTEVINKDVFAWNIGKEPIEEDAKDTYKTYEVDGVTYDAGVVYMYADNAELEIKDRIHHTEKETASQKSYVQKLVINDGTEGTINPDQPWNVDDFTFDGTVITGLSESGIAKRAVNKHLVLPDVNKEGLFVTEIAAAQAGGYGLFGAEGEGFDSVYLPTELRVIGNYAFQNNGLKEITFPSKLTTIGNVAFQTNQLTSVILPDSVTSLGSGAFATNPTIERISLSKGLTEIPASAFGCSDADNWMEKLTTIELHEGITSIGSRAFAGNNFSEIILPSTVTSVGSYAFSTKNYLTTPCTVTLNEGLTTIGSYAFRNKVISEITLPTTVTKLNKNTFLKEYSDNTASVVTKVYVSLLSQYEDTKNFPKSEYHKLYLTDSSVWTAEDFVYGEQGFALYPAAMYSSTKNFTVNVVTGFSEQGTVKLEENTDLVIPSYDSEGKIVQGIADNAFKNKGLTSLVLPEGVKVSCEDLEWDTKNEGVTERGDFFIGASAFYGNAFTVLDLPDGVIYVGGNAFGKNKLIAVTIPESVMFIGNQGFARNTISSLEFPAVTDFSLNIDNNAFAMNQIKSVQLPSNTEKVTKWAFFQNTGMEPVTTGNANEKKGGLVYMYMDAEAAGAYMNYKSAGTSNVQELILGTIPAEQTPWGVDDFTYDEAGITITGFSELGKAKIKNNPVLILPKKGPTGEVITALGDGVNMQGIFVYTEDNKNYTPSSVILPETLKTIGKWSFALNAALTYEADMTEITLPYGLESIGQTAFQNAKLTAVYLPDSVVSLGSGAFTGNADLTSLKLSAGLTEIPSGAFNAGTATDMQLGSLVVPEGIVEIASNAFFGTHITSLTLPSTLEEIGSSAFQNHQLKELVIPGSVTKIGNYAFRISQETLEATLTSLTLHEGLVTIGKEAFVGNAITEVDLPSTVVLSAKNKSTDCIFGDSKAAADPIVLLKVSDKTKVETYNTEFANTYSHVVVYDKLVGTGWADEDFTYNEETATITGWSESGHEKRITLKTLVLPDVTPEGKDIVAIGEEAFKIPDEEVIITKFGIDSPNGMKSVDLPENIKTIGKEAFSQNALTLFESNEIESIGERAFYGNDLTRVILNDELISLGAGAFATNDIVELRLSAGVTVIPQGCFSMNIRLDNIILPDTVTEIGATAFAGARLTELVIPESVTKIGEKAFHLHHLTELVIPGNVKEIGDSAFEGTYKETTLSKLVIKEGVESIGKYAFKEALLETVHFPESITTVGEKPFLNNKGKAGTNVVEVTTTNSSHLEFEDTTYSVVFLGGWKQDATGWWFLNADGTYPKNSWLNISEDWYYFNASGYRVEDKWQGDYYLGEDGIMVTNAWIDGKYVDETGKKVINAWVDGYYLGADGSKANCWIIKDGVDYYVKDGEILTDAWVDGYYLGEDGTIVRNAWVGDFYVGVTGQYLTGWLELEEGWYYLGTSGAVQTGWFAVDGIWYYADSESPDKGLLCENTWLADDDVLYYLLDGGTMAIGWQIIDEKDYYFDSNGAMVRNSWVGDYYLGEDGAMVTSAWVDSYYVDATGKYQNAGWLHLEEGWYYLGTNGVKCVGWQRIGGVWYYLNAEENGVMLADGLYRIGEKVYAFGASGAMLTGWQLFEGEWFYFTSSGAGYTGWIQSGRSWYYIEDGYMFYGTMYIEAEDTWAEFTDSGVWIKYTEAPDV